MTIRSIPIRDIAVGFILHRSEESSIHIHVRNNTNVYSLGQSIYPQVTITNTGTRTLTDITLASELAEFDSIVVNSLAAGQSYTYSNNNFVYQVAQSDILEGEAVFDFEVTALDPSNDKVSDSATYTYSVEEPRSSLSIVFTPDLTEYSAGDEIYPEITITNTGNLTITNIECVSEMLSSNWSVVSLGPGEEYVIDGSYEVTPSDITLGSLYIDLSASGLSPDPDNPDVSCSEEYLYRTAEATGSFTVDVTPNSTIYYSGDVIEPEITIANTGDLSITGWSSGANSLYTVIPSGGYYTSTLGSFYTVTSADTTTGQKTLSIPVTCTFENGTTSTVTVTYTYTIGSTITINYVAENGDQANPTFTGVYSYGSNYSVTTPPMYGYSADYNKVTGTAAGDDTFTVTYTANTYTVTISYVDMNGVQLAPSYSFSGRYGESYSVTSPVISGYTCRTPVVSGTIPNRNDPRQVIYTPNQVIIEDDDTPIGGDLNQGDQGEIIE